VGALEVAPLGELVEVLIEVVLVIGVGRALEVEPRGREPLAHVCRAELDEVALLGLDEDLEEGAVVRRVVRGDVAEDRDRVEEARAHPGRRGEPGRRRGRAVGREGGGHGVLSRPGERRSGVGQAPDVRPRRSRDPPAVAVGVAWYGWRSPRPERGMATEAARTDPNADVVARLVNAGERLPGSAAEALLRCGREVVPMLVEVLEDRALAQRDAPGGGYAPIHAARVLRDLEASEAIEPMLRVLARCDAMDLLYSALVEALGSFGSPVLEPALAVHAAGESEDQRSAIADVLSRLSVRDRRVLAVLLRMLEDDVVLGAGLLAEYGDPAALPHLGAALDRCELDVRGGLLANQDIVELVAAIEELGGALSEDQKRRVRAVEAARDEVRARLLAIGAPDDGDEDDPDEAERRWASERAEILRRFTESPHASGADVGWVDRALVYGAEYEEVPLAGFDARVLREVVFGLFPRKVSCEATAASEIVRSLRAFWTFARDVLAHPHAAACLAELGDEAIPRLSRRLEDPSNFGMAKSFVMMGRTRGFRVGSEEGLREWSDAFNTGASAGGLRTLPGRRSEENKRKKKLRKLRKQAQRRNRR